MHLRDLESTPEPMLPRPFTVARKRRDTIDTVTLDLEAQDGGGLEFAPGQFTMVYAFGVGEVPLSISGDPGSPTVLTHTVRAVGSVTDALCAAGPGDTLGVRGPYGTAWPLDVAAGTDIAIVAGGIGLAPVRPAIRHVLDNRDRYGSVSIVSGARTPGDLLYADEMRGWSSRLDVNVQVTVDRGSTDWHGDVGVVTPLLDRITFDPRRVVVLVCGPEIMMRVVARTLLGRGVGAQDVFVSLERNMKCGIGYCGHCQFGASFVCKDGPVFPFDRVAERLGIEAL